MLTEEKKQSIKWPLAFLALFITFMIIHGIFKQSIAKWDYEVYQKIAKWMTDPFTSFFKGITNLGGVYAIACICISAILGLKNKKQAICIIANALLIVVLNLVLKQFFERPRPEILRLVQETGYSFPSGHSMMSMAFYGYIIYLMYKTIQNSYLKWFLCIITSILIILIGISRIYLGVHYASDVIGGFCISIAYLCVFITATKKFCNASEKIKKEI